MTIRFTKMHGLGNDFMVIDAINQHIAFSAKQITVLADRHLGIGFDQCLLIEKSQTPHIDFFYRIFNADGGEVGQCGNGARCLARFVFYYGLTAKKTITVATYTTQMTLTLNDDLTVTINMGKPQFAPDRIPFLVKEEADQYTLPLHEGLSWPIHALNVGNPHAVSLVNNLDQLAVDKLGKEISEHLLFPEQCNAGFMQLLNKQAIRLRVYERGCGETSACGSGAVAAAAIARRYYQLEPSIHVHLPGGELLVSWPDINSSIYLTGPASFVYEGTLIID